MTPTPADLNEFAENVIDGALSTALAFVFLFLMYGIVSAIREGVYKFSHTRRKRAHRNRKLAH